MSYKPYSLFRLLEDIDAGRLLLPHIQRPFVWEREQMACLFDSLMRNYPIQTFLLWRTKEEIRARRFMPLINPDADLSEFYESAKSAADVEKVFVLDGQQRLQTLHCIFRGGIKEETAAISEANFDVTAGDAPADDGKSLYQLRFSAEKLPLPYFRVRDLSERFAASNPLTAADDLNDTFSMTLVEPTETTRARERRVRNNIVQLHSLLHHDKFFWADELDGVASQYPYRRILEIFVRVNSGGTKLTAGDLMFAAMKEGWDDIEERVEQTVDLLNGGRLSIDGDFVLKALLLAHGEGAEVQTEKFYGARGEGLLAKMEANWDRAELAFKELRDFMVQHLRLSADRLIRSYNALIPLFDFLFHNPKPTEGARVAMGAYYHKAQLFGWFSSQTDATLNVLHGIVGKPMGGAFPIAAIKTYFNNSRGAQTELSLGNLSDTRLRPLLLNIVYFDKWGASPFDVAFKGNEPHVDHIYPQYMLRSHLGCSSAEINDIGNLRFFGATDNIHKRAELPASYFSRLRAQGVPIERHLLVEEFAVDPSKLAFDKVTFDQLRSLRREAIWAAVRRVVDPETVGERSGRKWEDYVKFGFISAGQGARYRDAIVGFSEGDVFAAYLKGSGFVGVGKIKARAKMIRDVKIDGTPLLKLPLLSPSMAKNSDNRELSEYVALVEWLKWVPREQAKWRSSPKLYTTTHVRASLDGQQETVTFIEEEFGIAIREVIT